MSWDTHSVHTDCRLKNCYASPYRASGEPTPLVIDVCQSAARMRRNYGDAAAHHSTHITGKTTHIHTNINNRHTNRVTHDKAKHAPCCGMEEGGDGVVRGVCVQDDQIF